jgi:MoxR-like ATPase
MAIEIEERTKEFRSDFEVLQREISKIIVGHAEVIESVLIALFSGGHCLLEGVPGLGKTLLVRSLSRSLDLTFSRIQFTPDLMPADIVGTDLVVEETDGRRAFRFQPGPVFANIILADEINRATPKTQSALLEAMQEQSVTVGRETYDLSEPFLVMATQNPIEMEGTYPLPEAQVDRFFFKLIVHYSNRDELAEILQRTTEEAVIEAQKVMDAAQIAAWKQLVREVPIAGHVRDYAVRLVMATHPEDELAVGIANRYVRYGSSPRGAQALVLGGKVKALLAGRYNVSFNDIRAVALPALRHRIILNFEGEAEGVSTDTIIETILNEVPESTGEDYG